MAITSIGLGNFKCFASQDPIPIGSLTLIFGRNNSGKSSLLQSLMLLRQSLASPGLGPRLNLRGHLYDAGGFPDVVHQQKVSRNLEMVFSLQSVDHEPATLFDRSGGEVEVEFSSDEPQLPRLSRLTVKSKIAESLEIRRGRGAGGPFEMWIGDRRIGGERQAFFRFLESSFLPQIGFPFGKIARHEERARRASRTLLAHLERSLRTARFVGPFRQKPDRRYEYLGRVGGAPEFAGREVIDALIEDATRRKHRGELLGSVNQWLKQVGRVRLMPIRRISTSARLFELRMRDTDSGRWANYSDVGFGIGQALPVLVEGLRTGPGSTFVVQEPEIHLHPDAQLAMADFLLSLAANGTRVLAETHSDYMLLRVRRLIAQSGRGASRPKARDVSILYVDKDREGASHVRRLSLDDLGQMGSWPKGFMEEANEERLALLEAMAKKVQAGKQAR